MVSNQLSTNASLWLSIQAADTLGNGWGGIESQTLLSLAIRSPPLVHINSQITRKIVLTNLLVIAKTIEKKDLTT